MVLTKSALLRERNINPAVLPGPSEVLFNNWRQILAEELAFVLWQKCVFVSGAHILHCWGASGKAQHFRGVLRKDVTKFCKMWHLVDGLVPVTQGPCQVQWWLWFIEVFNKFQMTWLKSWVCNSVSTGGSLLCAAVGRQHSTFRCYLNFANCLLDTSEGLQICVL